MIHECDTLKTVLTGKKSLIYRKLTKKQSSEFKI